jgi:hypothetical protein
MAGFQVTPEVSGHATEKVDRVIENLELKRETLHTAVSRRETYLSRLREKQDYAQSREFRERVEGWIEDEEHRIKNVKDQIHQVEGWLDEELRKRQSHQVSTSDADSLARRNNQD